MLFFAIILAIIAVVCFIARHRVPDSDASLVLTVLGWLAAIVAVILFLIVAFDAADAGSVDTDLVLGPLALLFRRRLKLA